MTTRDDLLALLRCPQDGAGPLAREEDTLVCPRCAARYPVVGGAVCFAAQSELSAAERREQESRDRESRDYDDMFEGYPNMVELTTTLRRIGRPAGVILDHGAGTGRFTARLLELGQPVVAVDYSLASLHALLERCGAGAPVLAVQADVRWLPLRAATIHACTSFGVYGHLRGAERRRQVASELARVMVPDAPLALTVFNFNLPYRVWRRLGNEGAREGEHLFGSDFYYLRMTKPELRRELEEFFTIASITGIRSIPARSIRAVVARTGARRAADRFLEFMVERGYRVDLWLERTLLADLFGFYWLAAARRRTDVAVPPPPSWTR